MSEDRENLMNKLDVERRRDNDASGIPDVFLTKWRFN